MGGPAMAKQEVSGKIFRALRPPDESSVRSSFQQDLPGASNRFQMAELSNCFDEWKDCLETASHKLQVHT
jgi:hypothetical protein